jgi:L-histidine N-alpha-methyltransferase
VRGIHTSTPHFAASVSAATRAEREAFASDVEYYLALSPRQLPSRYLYDALGSALFEAICELPWYRITHAERDLLARCGREILSRIDPVTTLVELGPGSGAKLATLIEAGDTPGRRLSVHLIDVSPAALDLAQQTLGALDAAHRISIVAHQATYEAGLAAVSAYQRHGPGAGRTLTLFLGSNIGNFDPPGAGAFLRRIRASLAAGDGLLVGVDLVKPEAQLLLAYDDPLGVTAAFNRNLLVRLNRELDADFDLDAFHHRAVWNAEASRVEMHLVATSRQHVHVPAASLEVTFEQGETIWTESSYKYDRDSIVVMLGHAGFRRVDQWVDEATGFALTLVAAE